MKLRPKDIAARLLGVTEARVRVETAEAQPVTPAAVRPDTSYERGGTPVSETPPPVSSKPIAPKREAAQRPTSVSTLNHVQLPARFESAKLKLDLPLAAGTWELPLGDKTAIIEVPKGGASLHLEAAIDGKGGAPTLQSVSMTSTPPLKVKNAEDLVDLGIPLSKVAGKIMGKVADVQLRGLDIEPDGRLVPDLAVMPAFNPLHLAQSVPIVKSLMPRLNTDARGLLSGDLYADAYSGAVGRTVQPHGLDLKAVLGGLGAMAGEGHVELEVRTDIGDIALGKGAVGVRHDGSPMELKVSGDFLVGEDGALSSQLQGRVDTGLVDASFAAEMTAQATSTGVHGSVDATARVSSEPGGQIRLDSKDGALSVGHGALTATHTGDAIQVELGGKLLELTQGLGGALKMKLGKDVTAKLDAEIAAGADFGLDVTPDGISVSAGDAKAAVTSGGLSLAAPNYEVELGPGSQLTAVGQVSIDPERGFSVTDSQASYELSVPKGRMNLGPLRGALSGGDNRVEGTIELAATAPGGPTVEAQADARITGRGGLGRFMLPVDVTFERRVTLSGDRVEVKKL